MILNTFYIYLKRYPKLYKTVPFQNFFFTRSANKKALEWSCFQDFKLHFNLEHVNCF